MIKRELKINLKSFIIWLAILIIMFLFVYLIYPYIVNDESIKSLDELMVMFPPEVLKAFNMDMASLTSVYGWFQTEGFTFILIIVGLYSSIMGGTILLKEESDKTIEYLESLPIKRSKIVTNKIIVGIIYIVLMVAIIWLFNYVGLLLSGNFQEKQFHLLSITPLLVGLPLFALSLFISTLMHKTKGVISISLGLVFIFYMLNVLSELSENVKILKYFSLYTLADARGVINNVAINPINVIISLSITVFFICLAYLRYDKKELV